MPKTEAEHTQAGKNAIEWTSRNYYRHKQKQGDTTSTYNETKEYIKNRAEKVFARNDEKRLKG